MITMIYRHPSTTPTGEYDPNTVVPVDGNRFDYKIVNDDELDAALKDGWHLHFNDALAAQSDTVVKGKK